LKKAFNKRRQSASNLDKLIGQGYDGGSAMAGKEGGVQAIIRRRYPKALFVHCSSHRLNLVINDVNKVSEVRNVVGTVKAIIQFFRESSQRRKLVPNVPVLCETRWTHKYRSIRLFAENFVDIVEMLTCLSTTAAVKKTRNTAFQLLCAAGTRHSLSRFTLSRSIQHCLNPQRRHCKLFNLTCLECKHISVNC